MSLYDHKLVGERVITERGAGVIRVVGIVFDKELFTVEMEDGAFLAFRLPEILIESEFKSSIDLEDLDRACMKEQQRVKLNRLTEKFPHINWRDEDDH